MIDRLKEFDTGLMKHLHRSFAPHNQHLIDRMLNQSFIDDEDTQSVVAEIDGLRIRKSELRQLRLATPLDRKIMHAIIRLFQKRDLRICTVYRKIHQSRADFQEHLSSKYLSPEFKDRIHTRMVHLEMQ